MDCLAPVVGLVCGVRVRATALGKVEICIESESWGMSILGVDEEEAEDEEGRGKGYGTEAMRIVCAPLSMTKIVSTPARGSTSMGLSMSGVAVGIAIASLKESCRRSKSEWRCVKKKEQRVTQDRCKALIVFPVFREVSRCLDP